MPDSSLALLILIILFAIGFAIVNGFNDAANAIAPAVGSRAISPRNALIIAAVANLAGACTGTAVAYTIGKGILIPEAITFLTVIAALVSIIIWGTMATLAGLPISLTHGFVASLAASGMAAAGGSAVAWGVVGRVLSAVVFAPLLGFIGGFVVMVILFWVLKGFIPSKLNNVFSKLQILSASFAAYAHGKNDGQMPIGIIVLAMVTFTGNPGLWESLSIASADTWWMILVPALSISAGTLIGGWKVIKTIGMRVTTLRPVQGFTAQVSAAAVIEMASHLGIPVSTTHCITSSVMGVGATKRFSAVRWGIAGNIVAAWILTFPICGALGYFFSWLLHVIF
ncbi:MAG: inorganic phosphate transporter [Dehalococcoidales bacterium]|nr:inorganic phosphate transporter [Dehalococcoidales bacterium]